MLMKSKCCNASLIEINTDMEDEYTGEKYDELIGLKCSKCNTFLLDDNIIYELEKTDKKLSCGCIIEKLFFGDLVHKHNDCKLEH